LTAAALRGRVVLVQFWTFTCINWLRTLPYVRAWAHRYGTQGLAVIGVHTPEFDVEQGTELGLRGEPPVGIEPTTLRIMSTTAHPPQRTDLHRSTTAAAIPHFATSTNSTVMP
jgi:thiol-disulfide isomerase/thioredoxin